MLRYDLEIEIPYGPQEPNPEDPAAAIAVLRGVLAKLGVVIQAARRVGDARQGLWQIAAKTMLDGVTTESAHYRIVEAFDRNEVRSRWRPIRDDWDEEFPRPPKLQLVSP